MFTIVRDSRYVAFTFAPAPATIYPAIQWFKKLAPEWGSDNADRIASALQDLLLRAAAQGDQQGRSREMRCRIERTCEGVFRITLEDEPAWFDFNFRNTTLQNASRKVHQRVHIGIRKIFRNAGFHVGDNRMTALVNAAGTSDKTRPAATGAGEHN